MDMCGCQTIVNHPPWSVSDSSTNTFNYPPRVIRKINCYPDASNNNVGLHSRLILTIFFILQYLTQSNRGLCYLKNERAWKQWIRCLPYTKKEAELYTLIHQVGMWVILIILRKFHFDCDDIMDTTIYRYV